MDRMAVASKQPDPSPTAMFMKRCKTITYHLAVAACAAALAVTGLLWVVYLLQPEYVFNFDARLEFRPYVTFVAGQHVHYSPHPSYGVNINRRREPVLGPRFLTPEHRAWEKEIRRSIAPALVLQTPSAAAAGSAWPLSVLWIRSPCHAKPVPGVRLWRCASRSDCAGLEVGKEPACPQSGSNDCSP